MPEEGLGVKGNGLISDLPEDGTVEPRELFKVLKRFQILLASMFLSI